MNSHAKQVIHSSDDAGTFIDYLAETFIERLEYAIARPSEQPHIYSPIPVEEYTVVPDRDGRLIKGLQNQPSVCVSINRTIGAPYLCSTKRHYHQLRVVFEDGFAWIKLNGTWKDYMKCMHFVPRLHWIAMRHARATIVADGYYGLDGLRVAIRDGWIDNRTYGFYPQIKDPMPQQFNVNGIAMYEYASERTFSKLLPHTIIAMRACETLYGMTNHEYLKYGRHGSDTASWPNWPN